MVRFIFLIFLIAVIPANLSAAEFSDMIGDQYEIFSSDRPRFIKPSNARYFAWTSDDKTAVRYPAYPGSAYTLSFYGHQTAEIIVNFEGNKLSNIYISVYNRGDSAPINAADFQKKMQSLYDDLKKRFPGIKPVVLKEKLSDGMFVNAIVWRDQKFACLMKWSLSGKSKNNQTPEYLQVEFEPFNPQNDPAKRSLVRTDRAGMKSRANLTENLKREPNGNVYIDHIPMVDQGQKGYCVAAVIERVLQYYNIPVNQHTIAQLSGTTATGGTSVDVMVKNLEDVSIKLGIRVRDGFQLFEGRNAISKLKNIVSEYNRLARKEKKPETQMVVKGNYVYLDETIMSMDPELYAKVRNNDYDYREFERFIKKNILDGVPVIWCVLLGIMPEEKLSPQNRGGHMRLIIGFNDKNKEILYTDTWGLGHELKSMPMEYAWPITTRTLYVIPRERKRF